MNPDYTNPDLDAAKLMRDRYKNHIWTDAKGVPHKITDLTDVHLDSIIKLLKIDPNRIINGYKASDWMPIMISEYAVRKNKIKITESTVKTVEVDAIAPFPITWTHFEPIMVRPNVREYPEPRLVEYSETIYGKYHCVIELDVTGYRVGYVGVRENHPAYRQDVSAIITSAHGGIILATHQVATFRAPSIRMWYFGISFNREEDYPDVYTLDKYREYWAGTPAYHHLNEIIRQHYTSSSSLKGKGFFTIRNLDYVKEQLVKLVLDLEQYEKDKTNNATIKVAPF